MIEEGKGRSSMNWGSFSSCLFLALLIDRFALLYIASSAAINLCVVIDKFKWVKWRTLHLNDGML